MIVYIIKSSLCLIIMYGLYYTLLKPQKSLMFNRFFLLFSIGFSFAIPVLNFPLFLQPGFFTGLISEGNVPVLEISGFKQNPDIIDVMNTANTSKIKLLHALCLVYTLGFGFFTYRFVKNLTILVRKINSSSRVKLEGYRLILTDDCDTIHSFYNSVFINRRAYPDKIDMDLLKHEFEHLRQYHSIDIIIAELFQIIYWFNPICILYSNAIRTNHEYLADDRVIKKDVNVRDYSYKLIQYISAKNKTQLVSGFNQSFAKERIIMMSKSYQSHISKVKILALVPIISLLVLILSSFTDDRQGLTPIHSFRENSDSIHLEVDQMPVFNQDYESFNSWIASEMIYPEEAIEEGITGSPWVSFIVEIDGSVSNVKVWRSVCNSLDNEAVQIVNQSPEWIPGKIDNVAVRTYCTVAVKFTRSFERIDTKNIKLRRVYSEY